MFAIDWLRSCEKTYFARLRRVVDSIIAIRLIYHFLKLRNTNWTTNFTAIILKFKSLNFFFSNFFKPKFERVRSPCNYIRTRIHCSFWAPRTTSSGRKTTLRLPYFGRQNAVRDHEQRGRYLLYCVTFRHTEWTHGLPAGLGWRQRPFDFRFNITSFSPFSESIIPAFSATMNCHYLLLLLLLLLYFSIGTYVSTRFSTTTHRASVRCTSDRIFTWVQRWYYVESSGSGPPRFRV